MTNVRKRERFAFEPLTEDCAEQPSPEDVLLTEAVSPWLKRALARLTPQRRRAVVLYYGLEGDTLTADELATELAVGRGRALSLVRHAKIALRMSHELKGHPLYRRALRRLLF